MEERLTIRNFGPIRSADIEVHDLTIFVGPQATGKSLVAQLLFFLRGIEYLLAGDVVSRGASVRDTALSVLQWWLGNDLSMYVEDKTVLSLVDQKGEYSITWQGHEAGISAALAKRIEAADQNGRGEHRPQVYIPAGRSLYSFLPPHYTTSLRFVQNWPGYTKIFYETIGELTDLLWRKQEADQLTFFDATSDGQFLRKRMAQVLKGKMRYVQNTFALEVGKKHFPATTLSAGQMETWPFWAIVEARMTSTGPTFNQIYFEEPEAHLHPGAQVTVMEVVANLIQKEAKFLITTHSPYIVYAINNFLMAQGILDLGQTLPNDIPAEAALNADQVAAYRFSPDGTVRSIMDREIGLIDADELEQVANDLGANFALLQERLESLA